MLIELELGDEPGLSPSEQSTIVHELGHALGLSHPGGNPEDPAWLTDTTASPLATERVSADWVGREP